MLPTLDNIISYGAETIKGNEDYKRMLVDIYTTSLTVEHLGENDKVNGSKLAESILLNLRGSVDDVSALSLTSPNCLVHLVLPSSISISSSTLLFPSSISPSPKHFVLQTWKSS